MKNTLERKLKEILSTKDFQLSEIKTIIWDWNGTLLNDIEECIDSINILLEERNLMPLDVRRYREVFGFPVKNYYEKIGFNFNLEPFEIPANQFIENYQVALPKCKLQPDAEKVIRFFAQNNVQQVVLSAMEQSKLEISITNLGIIHYFKAVSGLSHNFATSKVDLGKELLRELEISPETACLIGDTNHDAEVASALGCHCILVADGHQNTERLKATNNLVVSNLNEIIDLFSNRK